MELIIHKRRLLNQKFKLKLDAMKESRKPPQYRVDVAQLRGQNRMCQLSIIVLNAIDANVKLVEGDELFLCNIRNTSLDIGKKDDKDGEIDNESFSSLHDEAKKIVREFKSIFPK